MAASEIPRLGKEQETFASHKAEWLDTQAGRYVVIKDTEVLGFFDSFQAAYTAGAIQFGIDNDFLVKRIVHNEPVFCLF
jgi:hypothetical protein